MYTLPLATLPTPLACNYAARNGSGKEGSTDEKWYELLNPNLSETNDDLGEVVNSGSGYLISY